LVVVSDLSKALEVLVIPISHTTQALIPEGEEEQERKNSENIVAAAFQDLAKGLEGL
jgi:hypothetical protein